MTAGRPRKYGTNADRQRAYRQRVNRPKALRNSLEEIQASMAAHNQTYKPNDSNWIDRSTKLFDELMAARRALLRAEQESSR